MSHSNLSSTPPFKRCVYFATDGVSLIKLPQDENESFSLIDSAGGDIRLLHFALNDAVQIAAVLEGGATFRFANNTLTMAASSGLLEFTPCSPDEVATKTPALPAPTDVHRLKSTSG